MENNTKEMLSRNEAAELLGIRPQTLAVWASAKRGGPPYVKLNRTVRYRREDVEQYVASRVVNPDAVAMR